MPIISGILSFCMPSKKPNKKKEQRTQSISINDVENHDLTEEPLQRVIHSEENERYELHIEAATPPGKGPQIHAAASALSTKKRKKSRRAHTPVSKGRVLKNQEYFSAGKPKIGIRIWNFLEWIAVSALIFVVFFFAMNWSSYSELIKLKLDHLTGNFELNPFIKDLITNDEGETQELLPMASTSDQGQTQIPPLSLDIAPPDDRIIIPRINKNVPVVAVSTENLIKRDWQALESDIQGALQGGVVHYPGTAQAGDTGNVVLTGHSSYFPWDPGRFKDVFALLHEIVVGDELIVYHDQKPFRYRVYKTQVVTPDQIEVLTQEGEDRLTLITCTPVGTNLKRLIVLAKPVRS